MERSRKQTRLPLLSLSWRGGGNKFGYEALSKFNLVQIISPHERVGSGDKTNCSLASTMVSWHPVNLQTAALGRYVVCSVLAYKEVGSVAGQQLL